MGDLGSKEERNNEHENTYIEMTFPDGTVVQWTIPSDSENETKVEDTLVSILGQPHTMKL